ncbi:hypothetical protein [Granulicella mallensis]|uniref:Uncharacterized protein n=1 Tax=Granulicella mallensis (strain ATCC BAA-1857 / DSM 23137 / MP5ACTX8) TaxID=682795 RepID=G8NQP1_GRAMM|nr:hypothetical protein [Granulicella mallensis]AEU37267.1 hypothetical protein AciX8_2964 [Granulicella mallensis MP5ACTX8]
MGYINDNLADYSRTPGAILQPAVSFGLTTYALFGRTLEASLVNYANSAAPMTVTTVPTIDAVSGLVTTLPGELVTPDLPSTGSETIYFVASINPSNWASFASNPFGSLLNNSFFATEIIATNEVVGVQANLGFVPTGGGTSNFVRSINAGGSATLGTDTATQAVISNPQMYMLKLDIPNLMVTWQNLSHAASSWKSILAIPAGATRPVNIFPYSMLAQGTGAVASNGSITNHAYIHYNRATLASEDALIYAQAQRIMAARGITI